MGEPATSKTGAADTGLGLWLQRLRLRTNLSAADEAIVMSLPGRLDRIRINHDFVRLGERIESACLIVDGTAARFGQTKEGARQLSAIHVPGDMADLHSAVLPHAASALSALSNVVVYRVPHAALHEAVRASPALARAFWRDCVVDAAIAVEWLLNNGRREARARVAHLICELALRYADVGQQRDRFTLGMTQMHLADACSLTAVHVNRMLGELRRLGVVSITGQNVEIKDFGRLATIGDFDEGYLHRQKEHPDIGR